MIIARDIHWCLARLAEAEAQPEFDLYQKLDQLCSQIDPLTRALVRKRVLQHVHDAQLTAGTAGRSDVSARLAFIDLLGEYTDPEQPQALLDTVARCLKNNSYKTPTRRMSYLLAAVLLLSLCATAFLYLAPDYWLDSQLEKPRKDAFVKGGRPLPLTAAQRTLLAVELPQMVIAIDRARVMAQEGTLLNAQQQHLLHRLQLFTDQARERLGTQAAQLLKTLLEKAIALVCDKQGKAETLYRMAAQFNHQLALAGVGYQADIAVLESSRDDFKRFLLAGFAVEWVEYYHSPIPRGKRIHSGTQKVRVQRWQRLDRLNFTRGALGYTSQELGDARVLMDRIDAFMTKAVIPALAPKAALTLVDEDARYSKWARNLQTIAGEHTRMQLGLLVSDPQANALMAEKLTQRNEFFVTANAMLAERGIRVSPPEYYLVDIEQFRKLKKLLMAHQWRKFSYLQSTFESGAVGEAHRTIRHAFSRSVERHEVQHRLDDAFTDTPPMPAALEPYLGPLSGDKRKDAFSQRTISELSAYLAELARGPQLVKVNLALIGQNLFDRTRWASAECYAAVVIFQELAAWHKMEKQEMVVEGDINRKYAAILYQQLAAKEPPQLSHAALKVWEQLYGRPLAPLITKKK